MAAFALIGLLPVFSLVIVGIMIRYYKAYGLISGYNTMPNEKKKNVDIEGLAKFTGNVCFFIAGIILAAVALMMAGLTAASGIVFALLAPVTVYTVIMAQKYDGNTRKPDGSMKTGTKVLISSITAGILLISAGVGVLLYFSSKPAEYSVSVGALEISGMYGEKVPLNEIANLELKEQLPEILAKTNGSALGNMMKGNFRLENIGKTKLFVNKSVPPFILIKGDYQTIIINCSESEKTRELYEKLKGELHK